MSHLCFLEWSTSVKAQYKKAISKLTIDVRILNLICNWTNCSPLFSFSVINFNNDIKTLWALSGHFCISALRLQHGNENIWNLFSRNKNLLFLLNALRRKYWLKKGLQFFLYRRLNVSEFKLVQVIRTLFLDLIIYCFFLFSKYQCSFFAAFKLIFSSGYNKIYSVGFRAIEVQVGSKNNKILSPR